MASKNPCIRVASPAGDWTRNSAHKTGFKRPRTGPERIPSRISLDLSLLGQARPARTPSGDSLQVSPGLSCRDSDKFLPAILWHRDPTLTPTRHPACLRVQHHLVRGSEGDVWITASPGESAVDILAHTPHQRHLIRSLHALPPTTTTQTAKRASSKSWKGLISTATSSCVQCSTHWRVVAMSYRPVASSGTSRPSDAFKRWTSTIATCSDICVATRPPDMSERCWHRASSIR